MEEGSEDKDLVVEKREGYYELPLTAEELRAELGALRLVVEEILKRIKEIEKCIKD